MPRHERSADAHLGLPAADRRAAQLTHLNPLIEAASRRTIVRSGFVDMVPFHTTTIESMNDRCGWRFNEAKDGLDSAMFQHSRLCSALQAGNKWCRYAVGASLPSRKLRAHLIDRARHHIEACQFLVRATRGLNR
jgi:hypothetical protein